MVCMSILTVCVAIGGFFYAQQLQEGFIVTNLSDQVSWGAYIASFTFLVGVAAAAVLVGLPAYLGFGPKYRELTVLGPLTACVAIIMALGFVFVDLGRPERFWHLIPVLGRMNFPDSVLAWDALALNAYLALNVVAVMRGLTGWGKPVPANTKLRSRLWIAVSLLLAVGIHVITAFSFAGLGGRAYWNSGLLAPRFLISAFASAPALMILVIEGPARWSGFNVPEAAKAYLLRFVAFAIPVDLFLLVCEAFASARGGSHHRDAIYYLFIGLDGYSMVRPFAWMGIAFLVTAAVIAWTPGLRQRPLVRIAGAGLCVVGVWVHKGMGLIVPGFVPSPLGDRVDYSPSVTEFFVCLGVWALGGLLLTYALRVAALVRKARALSPALEA